MFKQSLLFLLALLPVAFGSPLRQDGYVIVEDRKTLPVGWNRHSPAPGDMRIPIRIALTQSNLHLAESYLLSVSDPASSIYGQHWSKEQIIQTFAPTKNTVKQVKSWLVDNSIKEERITQSNSQGWIQIIASVAEIELLLQTEFYIYEHSSDRRLHVGCETYSVPLSVRAHIDLITPTVHFDTRPENPASHHQGYLTRVKKRNEQVGYHLVKKRESIRKRGLHIIVEPVPITLSNTAFNNEVRKGLKVCDQIITPNCIKALYDFSNPRKANPKNSFAVVEYTPESFLNSDFDPFFKNFTLGAIPAGTRPIVDGIDGGIAQTTIPGPNGTNFFEASLDLQYGIALSYPVPVIDYQTGDFEGSDFTASFNNFLDGIDGSYCTYDGGDDPTQDQTFPDPGFAGPQDCGKYTPAPVISTSYGYDELDLTPAYEMRQCHEYMKLGLQGVTFLFSSGDSGVASQVGDPYCLDGYNGTLVAGGKRFVPSFPGTCPYVTAVGATQILPNHTVHDPEAAAYDQLKDSLFTSGGGFSDVFALPAYQKNAVDYYYRHYKPPYTAAQYNNSRQVRGYPDVSANGQNYVIVVQGQAFQVDGTSASSPVFGAIITAINNARFDAGKSSIGFINPALYKNPDVLNDITAGNNVGCGTNGFSAVPGWDPVTGLGTPNFPKMKKLFLSLP